MKRCAVFSSLGLGDGLIALVLANNLYLNGCELVTFHPFLQSLQDWFPHLPLRPFPSDEDIPQELARFDRFFFIYEKSTWMQAALEYCMGHYPERTVVLNPIATANRDYPYWEQGKFDGKRPFVDNLYGFCKDILKLTMTTKSNGIVVPSGVQPKSFHNRVILHPMSSRPGKNWPQEKYLELALQLKKRQFEPVFILTQEERQGWELGAMKAPLFAHLAELASFICESGYMIGNDSGIGHLASCLGLPTMTICRSVQTARFWRPAWSFGKVLTPPFWVPNLKGMRWRDQYWKKWITVKHVLREFQDLVSGL
jgi:hypothetical protein